MITSFFNNQKFNKIKFVLIFVLLVLIGISSILYELFQTKQTIKKDFVNDSRVIASSISLDDIGALTATPSDTSLQTYTQLKQQLQDLKKSIPDCRFVYVLGLQADSVFFFLDSEPSSSKDCSPPGQIYSEASQTIYTVFYSKEYLFDGPYTDRWGTWFSSFIPIINPKTGEVDAVVGVDVSTENWNNLLFQKSAFPIFLILCSVVLIYLLLLLGRKTVINRQKTEQLIGSESKFRTMFSTHTAVMLLIDPDSGRIIQANESALRFYGYTSEQLLNMTIYSINCLDKHELKQAIHQAILNLKNDFLFNHKLANGDIRAVEELTSPLITEEGMHLFSIITDVTDRNIAEELVKKNDDVQKKLLTFVNKIIELHPGEVDYSSICDVMLEISGAKYVSFNLFDENGEDFTTVAMSGLNNAVKQASSVLGFEIINKKWPHDPIRQSKIKDNTTTIFNSLHELTGSNLPAQIVTFIEKTFNIGEVAVVKIEKNTFAVGDFTLIYSKNDTVNNINFLEIYANQIGLFLSRVRSDEKMMQSKNKMEAIISASPDGIGISSIDGHLEFMSDNLLKLYGYSVEEGKNYIGTPFIAFIDPSYHSLLINNVGDILAGKRIDTIAEYMSIKKDSSRFFVEINTALLRDEQGNPTSFLFIQRDVTKRKQLEAALTKSKEDAETASIAKSEFLATMSHEIRTPLNGVIGYSDILMKTKLSPKQSEFLHNLHISANSLLDLINDILDFSKIEVGKLDLNAERIDLIELAENIVDIMKLRASEKEIESLLNISPTLPRFIDADPVRLRQILVNLIGNAIKFTERGEIELKIEAFPIEGKEDVMTFTFSVRDSGIGIPESKLQTIFESFSQADGSTTRKYGGTGLGLSISNTLVQKMGSHIEVSSEIGVGSCFSFHIDLPFENTGEEEVFNLEWVKKVLVVDDNATNRNIIASLLEPYSIVCDHAPNGIVAMELIEKNEEYDIVIIDYTMPHVNGLQVIKNIRENDKHSHVPIIFLYSSYEDETIYAECKALHVKGILQKPIRMNQLYRVVSQLNSDSDLQSFDSQKTVQNEEIEIMTLRKYTILIVDDNKMNLNLASSLVAMNMPNAEIIVTTVGSEVLQLYVTHKPDLILMDIQMPIMNGYEVATAIRTLHQDKNKRVPIIALTAGTVLGEKERCIEAGMDDYISKPLHAKTLFQMVEKYLLGNESVIIEQTPTEPAKLVHFDREDLLKTYNNNEAFANKMLALALNAIPQYLVELEYSIKHNDQKQIKFNAHTIKGMAKGICFTILSEAALKLEKSSQLDSSQLNELFKIVKDEFDYLKKEYLT